MLSRRATAHPDRANTPAIRARAIRARAKLLAQRYSCPRIRASPREYTRDGAPVCNSDIRYMHPRAFRCSSCLARAAPAAQRLARFDFQMLNGVGDLFDLIPAVMPKLRRDFARMSAAVTRANAEACAARN